MQHRERRARGDTLADLHDARDAHGGINHVLSPHPTRAQAQRRERHRPGIHRRHETRTPRQERLLCAGLRQVRRIIDHASVATLRDDDLAELGEGRAAPQRGFEPRTRLLLVTRDAAEHQHVGAQRESDFHHVGRTLPAQAGDGLRHLEGVAHGMSQRLVHAREQGPHAFLRSAADAHQRRRKFARLGQARHEGAAAELHVEHERIDSLGELLGKDRSADERHALHRRGDVAQRVELPVGWREVPRLPDERATHPPDLGHELVERERSAEARDRLQFVERAAGMPKAATTDHRHGYAAGGDERSQRQGNLVAHAAGRVLVNLDPAHGRKVGHGAGAHHRVGIMRRLIGVHAAQEHRHQHRGKLVVCPRSVGRPPHEDRDLVAGQRVSVPLACDDRGRRHTASRAPLVCRGKRALGRPGMPAA